MEPNHATESDADPSPAVVAEGLRFSYPERTALDGVSFQIETGSLFGFLGPNGGGKTTLFRILATLLPPGGGSVRIGGDDVRQRAAAVRRRLGVVFQSPSLDLELTVRENLVHQGRLYGLGGRYLAERIDDGLERLGLTDRAGEVAKTLSGGLRRRAEIAKSLLHRPEVLLLDEPSTGLDPGARRDLWRTLDELRRGGMTVLLTTHFIEEAERCDRLLLLDRGRVVAEGSPAELEAEIGGDVVRVVPRDDAESFRRDLAERFPELGLMPTEDVHDIQDGGGGDGGGGDRALRFELTEGHRFVARLAEAFPGRIESITVSRPSLEDVFLRHTGHGLYGEEPQEESREGLGETSR